jgi:hypothetical protein
VQPRQMPLEPSLICPQIRQRASLEEFVSSRPESFALPSLLRRCVKRVAGAALFIGLILESQMDFLIHSAKLATAVFHMIASLGKRVTGQLCPIAVPVPFFPGIAAWGEECNTPNCACQVSV